jgi:hypothetical protein
VAGKKIVELSTSPHDSEYEKYFQSKKAMGYLEGFATCADIHKWLSN